jgi:glycosyltransferase involved in cell wall biosynthesis
MPKLSIGMPLYNGGRFIEKSISSLINQTYTDFELIISDNCSNDDTEEICLKFKENDNRIKYYKQESNLGATSNFNYVLNNSSGEYFMWAAFDDIWDPNFISECINVLENNLDCVSVFTHFIIYDINSYKEIERITPSSLSSDLPSVRIMKSFENLVPNMIYGIHRREILAKNKYIVNQDWNDILIVAHQVFFGKYFILPKYLHMTGINGEKRKPYSLNGKYLNLKYFRIEAFKLIFSTSSNNIFSSLLDYLRLLIRSIYAERKINRTIKTWNNLNT